MAEVRRWFCGDHFEGVRWPHSWGTRSRNTRQCFDTVKQNTAWRYELEFDLKFAWNKTAIRNGGWRRNSTSPGIRTNKSTLKLPVTIVRPQLTQFFLRSKQRKLQICLRGNNVNCRQADVRVGWSFRGFITVFLSRTRIEVIIFLVQIIESNGRRVEHACWLITTTLNRQRPIQASKKGFGNWLWCKHS